MLLDNDVVADGKAEAGSFPSGLCRKERIEHLFFHFRWNTGAVVPNPDFHTVPKVPCRGRKSWLIEPWRNRINAADPLILKFPVA
jgi:hypothetical protein